MIWENLSKARLQSIIGNELLERLEHLLPVLSSKDYDNNELYRKTNLIKVFNAFITTEFFRNKKSLRELLNSTPPEELKNLCEITNVKTSNSSFEEMLQSLVNQGWHDTEYCEKFLRWAELPLSFLPAQRVSLSKEELLHSARTPYKTLKDYQFGVYLKAQEELSKNLSRFVIQMPTGSGKTRTAMEFITDFINNSSENSVVVWLAHSEELCEQSLECFKEIWAHVAKRELWLFRCWGGNTSLPYVFSGSAFVVAGFQKLYSILTRNKTSFDELSGRVGLIVVDEAHKVTAPTYKKVTKALMGAETRVVGLTATPGSGSDSVRRNEELRDFFFNNIVSIEATDEYRSEISYLRDKKVLAKVKAEPLISGRNYELSPEQEAYLEGNLDFPPGFLSMIGADDVRNLEIVKRLTKELSHGRRALFFACSVQHSRFICSLLVYLGYESRHIDGATDKGLRRQFLEDFKNNRVQVLCNYGVLSTGFDAPKTDLIFISRPTTSIVLYSQMVGRGLRGPAIGGTEHCKLIDVRDNIVSYSDYDDVYNYFEEYWS